MQKTMYAIGGPLVVSAEPCLSYPTPVVFAWTGAGLLFDEPSLATEQLKRHVVLTAIHADTPARQKLAKHLGTGAYLNCGYCLMQSTR